jgi:hypothetical protein
MGTSPSPRGTRILLRRGRELFIRDLLKWIGNLFDWHIQEQSSLHHSNPLRDYGSMEVVLRGKNRQIGKDVI